MRAQLDWLVVFLTSVAIAMGTLAPAEAASRRNRGRRARALN